MTTTTRRRLAFGTALAAAVALTIAGIGMSSAAYAGGSDAPTPYTVTAEGLQLNDGATFPEHGHVNWRTTWAQHGVHFDPNNGHPGGKYIGESFLAWNLEPGECVEWVQVSMYNEHFGEGGQAPVCAPVEEQPPVVTPEPETPPTTPPTLECPEYTVPGWLDENGNPQGCVENHPCPGLEAPACIPTDEETPWNPEPTDPPTDTTSPPTSDTGTPENPGAVPNAPAGPAEPSTVQLPMPAPSSSLESSTGGTPTGASSSEHGRTELPATGLGADPLNTWGLLAVMVAGLGIILASAGAIQARQRRRTEERLERIATGEERSPLFD